ncbi:sigma-54 interaction domain-containing protein [Flavonifractor hominis]|uniref:HTH-type transcriptional regulatory protein TyrR n=1 Tax=Flavonifractor hominis TaxID=3133178 RepID=A0ABV1EPE8_9FIRM
MEQENALYANIDFQKVCENLYDGIHITDGEGRVLFINQAYTRTTGILPEELLGRKVADIEAEGKLYKGSVTGKVLECRQRVNSVATIFKLNKEVLVTGTPVFDEAGNIVLVVTNTRDFPELKRLEQQLLTLTEESKKANEELTYLRRQQAGDRQLFYRSQAMASVMELVRTVAPTDVTVLITGESGTGKELVANEIYHHSDRVDKPFIKVNCAAIPGELLESELFGYEDGAFTGAKRAGKAGMFELANTGVILLDEIGDMPLPLQTKLLRVLQQRELMRIGGSRPIRLDIRVIASTNKDLQEEVRQGRFREDLFYRLNVVPLEIKPLRERPEDIPYLAERFCQSFNKKYGKDARISDEAMQLILAYRWPGNIRELENLIERIVVTSPGGVVTRGTVYNALNPGGMRLGGRVMEDATLRQQVSAFEREVILHTVERAGSIRKAARLLGVDHSTLVKKCRQYGCQEQKEER